MSSEHNKSNTFVDPSDPTAQDRKLDHIEMAFKSQVECNSIDNRFYYEPLLSGHPKDDNDDSFTFLDSKFKVPLWVSSMTGGTKYANTINKNLAMVCNEFGFGMGLGSCRSLLHSNETLEDFDVRKYIGDQLLYANLGIAQVEKLVEENNLNKITDLLSKLRADGLIIHINPMQEWLQPEGDRINHPPINTISELINKLDINIIVKEVGQGMGYHSLKALFQLPIKAIDFAANGGTNFAKIEMARSEKEKGLNYADIANIGHSAYEMVLMSNRIKKELGAKFLCNQVIVSGGVKNFLDGYYYIEKLDVPAIYGQASTFLKYALGDYEPLRNFVKSQVDGFNLAKTFLRVKE